MCLLVGLVAGLGGETLLFLQRQCRVVEESLRDDFRVLLFMRADLGEGKQKVLEEQLRALPDVDDVRAVSRQEQLSALKKEDPELVESVALIGDNPLMPAFEVRFNESGVSRVSQWIMKASALADFADVRYKPAQIQAILQAQFYARFLDLALAALVCLGAALALAGIWSAGRSGALLRREGALAAGLTAAGCVAGAGLVCAMVLPLRALAPWWGWPPVAGQAALLAGASAAGWVLCARSE